MEWDAFITKNIPTIGVTMVFAAIGSGVMLWVRSTKEPVTMSRAAFAFASGQFAALIITPIAFGVMLWSKFFAPLIGALCGLVGVFFIRGTVKGGERIEGRADDIADAGIDILKKKGG